MAIDIIDLLHTDGTENPSGLATLHGFALLSDFTTLQRPKDMSEVGATLANIASIAAAHVFPTGKCMKKLYGTQNKGTGGYEPMGEADSMGFKSKFNLSLPGSRAEADGMARVLNNSNAIFFIQETDGIVRQYGSERFPCKTKVKYDTGNNEGYRGYTIEVEAYGQAVIYTPGLNFTPTPA